MSSFLKRDEPVLIWTGKAMLDGVLTMPRQAEGLVVILGLGGTFHHDHIRLIAAHFTEDHFATLVADVLTADEQQFDKRTGHFRVDGPFLTSRVRDIVHWARSEPSLGNLPIALFAGSATAAACAAASVDLSLFALALAAPRLEALRDQLPALEMPTLLMFDHGATEVQSRELARAGFNGTILTIPDASSPAESDLAAVAIAREAGLWFQQHCRRLVAA